MTDDTALPDTSVSQHFCRWAAGLETAAIPDAVRRAVNAALLDYAGLCVAARDLDYVGAMIRAQAAAQGGAAHAQRFRYRVRPEAGQVAAEQDFKDPVGGAREGKIAGFVRGGMVSSHP